MKSNSRFLSATLFAFVLGCSSGGGGPTLAPVDGEVTFQGKPIAGASVLFVPEKGPVAMGLTDLAGKFTLSTGPNRGAVLGPCKATISVPVAAPESTTTLPPPPKTQAEAEAYMKAANEIQAARIAAPQAAQTPTSPIPEKYGKADTSGLSYTIKAGNNNHIKIELQ